jgi:hypothetical protein
MNSSFSVARPAEVPMPAAVAARPRDERGYPVPAVTPWPDGTPAFAFKEPLRDLICAAQRRCTICGTKIPPGPVYRPVEHEIAEQMARAWDNETLVLNPVPQREGPGHRACMIYAAIVCPYLASPAARRKIKTHAGPETIPRGDPRGPSGAVVGYDRYSWGFGPAGIAVTYGWPVEFLPYASGADLADELHAEIARERGPASPCPTYLLDDDEAAHQAALAILPDASPRAAPARRQDKAAKARRRATRAARRKNR